MAWKLAADILSTNSIFGRLFEILASYFICVHSQWGSTFYCDLEFYIVAAMCLLQKIYCDSNSTKNVGCNNSYSNSTSLLLFELTSQLGTNRSIGLKFGTHYQHCVHQSYIFVKNVWTPDKSWEPGILKFECYWKLWKTWKTQKLLTLTL